MSSKRKGKVNNTKQYVLSAKNVREQVGGVTTRLRVGNANRHSFSRVCFSLVGTHALIHELKT